MKLLRDLWETFLELFGITACDCEADYEEIVNWNERKD